MGVYRLMDPSVLEAVFYFRENLLGPEDADESWLLQKGM